nr:hypothetical protein CVCH_006 [Cavernulicola chilensis]
MHVAWIGKKTPFCGNVVYSKKIINELKNKDYKISFLCISQNLYNNPDQIEDAFLPCLYKSQICALPISKSPAMLTKVLKEINPDLIHVSLTLSPLDFLLPEICINLAKPLIGTFHTPFSQNYNIISNAVHYNQCLLYKAYAPFLNKYEKVVVFSEAQRILLVDLGVSEYKLVVIPNGVNHYKYLPGNSHLKKILQTKCIFIYQGRISPEKNIESLLYVWKNANMSRYSKLLIMGNGPLAATLIGRYGTEQGIIWLGFISDEIRREEIFKGADVFILPSLTEGLPLSLLEAMSCGAACITTDVGVNGEVLTPSSGVVLDNNSIENQLYVILPLLAKQKELRQVFGIKAREKILQDYSLNNTIKRLEEVYKNVLYRFRHDNSKPSFIG